MLNIIQTGEITSVSGDLNNTYAPLKNIWDENTLKISSFNIDDNLLNFTAQNPVDIEILPSYDGSVNLLLTDDYNNPMLINSRFTVKDNNTYEIIDRSGITDTNLYLKKSLKSEVSLYSIYKGIPQIKLLNVDNTGNFPVGNYTFLIKYTDADGNETDFAAESGLVVCFIGNDGDPYSVNGGIKDQNSKKAITLKINNVDTNFDYVHVYYTRKSSDEFEVINSLYYKINKLFSIKNRNEIFIRLTGDEDTTLITADELNTTYFVAETAKSQAIVNNRLFLANVSKLKILYDLLKDISLRCCPKLSIDKVKIENHNDSIYNNTSFIYNYVGYWPEEIYRFGIVYIYNNNTLSPVFNIRGILNLTETTKYTESNKLSTNLNEDWNYINVNKDTNLLAESSIYENAKGVIRIDYTDTNNSVIGILFEFLELDKILSELQKMGIVGYFFVRQKRIPTILGLIYLQKLDKVSRVPTDPDGNVTSFCQKNKILGETKFTCESDGKSFVGICPDYNLRQAFYNNLFTGNKYILKELGGSSYINNVHLIGVPDGAPGVEIVTSSFNKYIFKAKAGDPTDGSKFLGYTNEEWEYMCGGESTWDQYKNKIIQSHFGSNKKYTGPFIRGLYGTYLGVVKEDSLSISDTISINKFYNIYIQNYDIKLLNDYFQLRFDDQSAYYAISDRYEINNIKIKLNTIYRGDCYIGAFTHRINRNFQDPESPNNDIIVNKHSFENWDPTKQETFLKINRGDINAVPIGDWITTIFRSTLNISIRSTDESQIEEKSLTGHSRSFYPLSPKSKSGSYKIPESTILNAGFSSSLGDRWNFITPDVPYIKDNFQNRIIYSDIAISGGFQNGFRIFNQKHYRDWNTTYGGITKILEFSGKLVIVFEHGVSINDVGGGTKENDKGEFLNNDNVLPFNPTIINGTYGSTWKDSIIKTDQAIYGVDTIAKKIWCVNKSGNFKILSDLKILKFLNKHILLNESDKIPIIGIKNVKTHYNAYKGDIMFTFYNQKDLNYQELWNLCYNEKLDIFTTFYSWIPLLSENINNIFFSFDRYDSFGAFDENVKFGEWFKISNYDYYFYTSKVPVKSKSILTLDGLFTSNMVSLKNETGSNFFKPNFIKTSGLKVQLINNVNCFAKVIPAGIYDVYFMGIELDLTELLINNLYANLNMIHDGKIMMSHIDLENQVLYNIKLSDKTNDYIINYLKTDFLCGVIIDNQFETISKLSLLNTEYLSNLTGIITINKDNKKINISYYSPSQKMSLWLHGNAGIFDKLSKLHPTNWYGKLHPFEFEFLVMKDLSVHKIFNDLIILGNNAEPESFHFQIKGDSYDFSNDKENMYFRLEATKALYQSLGSDIKYDQSINDAKENITYLPIWNLNQNVKSTLFPCQYFSRQDVYNSVYDNYKSLSKENYDYDALSGAEIVKIDDDYGIENHVKAKNIETVGRLRGNMQYKEDRWFIQINPLILVQKNEKLWPTEYPPIVLGNSPIPEDIKNLTEISNNDIPNFLKNNYNYNIYNGSITTDDWGVLNNVSAKTRSEAKLKDKYIKIRIRYSGKKLAVIHQVLTYYTSIAR